MLLVEGAVSGSSTDTPPEESEDDGLVNTDARVDQALQRAQTLDIPIELYPRDVEQD